jgi:hypothetical protein
MMVDGVMQAMRVAGVVPSIAYRDLRDQSLFAAHLIVGAGLLFASRAVYVGRAGFDWRPSRSGRPTYVSDRIPVAFLLAALAISLIEATWFDWIGTAVRAVYTAAAVFVLLRRTTLPMTEPDSSS